VSWASGGRKAGIALEKRSMGYQVALYVGKVAMVQQIFEYIVLCAIEEKHYRLAVHSDLSPLIFIGYSI